MLVVSWFIGTIINYSAIVYICKYIMSGDKKINITLKKCLMVSLIAIINCILLYNNIVDIKPYILQIALFIGLKLVYKESIVKILISMIFSLLTVGVAEMLFGIPFGFITNVMGINNIEFSQQFYGYLIINIIITIISLLLIRIPFIHKLFLSIIKWYEDNEKFSLMILGILVMTIIEFLLYNNFILVLPSSLLFITNLFCIGVFVFVIGFFKEKSNNNKLKSDYQQLMNYIDTYEKLLDEKNKSQHEYKNQLIMINDMIKTKKAKEYIKDLINLEEENIEYSWMNKLKNLPSGGIKGLIYYKIQKMLENKIEVCVDISDELDNKKIWKNFNSNLKDISMILGVYIDNAIEACTDAQKKVIIIDAYLEDKKICIGITNTYKQIKIEKIKKERYTTKGKGHGYGLSLVKDIVSKNNNISTKREINGMYYTERIYVKK